MKLFIKEKVISLHNRYFIYNEAGEQVYELVSQYLSFGDKTQLLDMNGNELVYVEQELFHLKPLYKVFIGGNQVATVKRTNFIGAPKYEVPELSYNVQGNLLSTEFNITDAGGNLIANASRKLISIGDKYQLEILDENNLLYILGVLITIINVIDNAQEAASSSN